jgi:carbamoyl-phosphate synthase large subunit
VDAVSDGHDCAAVVMEQVEHAGIHSGDSACVYPPYTLPPPGVAEVERATALLAQELGVIGLMNVQFALHEGILYLLEVNARASRTVPFASKAAGIPLARLATQVILGAKLRDLDLTTRRDRVAVKLPVFPFRKLPDLVPLLRPEMQSTGETMGLAADFPTAYAKALAGAGFDLSGGAGHALVVGTDKLQAAIILEQAGFTVKSELVEVGVAGWDDVALVGYMGDASAAPLDLLREATLRGVPVIGDIRALEAYLCAHLLGHPWLPTAL